ncbi:MAG: hypothetical protein ACXWLR_06575, partial [Myxococcales bacterium]
MLALVRERRWTPWLLGLVLFGLLAGTALSPSLQLFYRDTGRNAYPYKQFIAQQLRAGASPFWNPWTESGAPVLAQVTPGLFHPLTALYLALPFDWAFKLNHLAALPLAWAGMFLLARRLGTSTWAAATAAGAYAGCGYLVSTAGSNLAYALGSATVPLALHGLLRALERFSPARLLWASFALALCVYAGDPQSALISALIGAVWVLAGHRSRRGLGILAAWTFCALLLAAPAELPVLPRLLQSTRASGITGWERSGFSNSPARLAGVVVPWAFDDRQDVGSVDRPSPYPEYFVKGPVDEAFATSIALGAPILLLAALSGRRGAWLAVAGILLLLATTGDAMGFQQILFAIPGMKLFRYAEKLAGPSALLLCLSGAMGAEEAARRPRRFFRAAAGVAATLALLRFALVPLGPRLQVFLQLHGKTHAAFAASWFIGELEGGLLAEAGLCAALAGAALLRAGRMAPAVASVCAAAALTQSFGLLFTAPADLFHSPVLLADELKARAGPSEGRWRIRGSTSRPLLYDALDPRVARAFASLQILNPQYHQLAGIESVSAYTSLADLDYEAALATAPGAVARVMGVRFDLRTPEAMTAAQAERLGYLPAAFGTWVKELPERPRAFFARCALVAVDRGSALAALGAPDFRPEVAVTRKDLGLPCPGADPGRVTLERPAADRLRALTDAAVEGLLLIAEHYEPGWRATIDGVRAETVQADLSALALVVPAGKHAVELRYRPPWLWTGALLAA